jgi:hypothetical protein
MPAEVGNVVDGGDRYVVEKGRTMVLFLAIGNPAGGKGAFAEVVEEGEECRAAVAEEEERGEDEGGELEGMPGMGE